MMQTQPLEAVDLCRAAADSLDSEANRQQTVLFPGWDFTGIPASERADCEAIRRVARAIGGDEDPDSGTAVRLGDLAELLRYIADMLEE
jgi:hypothetical protein